MPLSIPSFVTIRETSFRIQWPVTPPSRSRGGEAQVVQYADPFWIVRLTTPMISSDELLALRAWFDGMGAGSVDTFLTHDYARPFPINYYQGWAGLFRQDNTTPFNGTAALSALSAHQMTITTLPDNFVIKQGDYIGLVQSGRYSLHQAKADVTGNTSGIAANVPVTPPVNIDVFTTGATVNLERPKCEIVPDPNSWSGDPDLKFAPTVVAVFGGVSRIT